MQGSSLGRYLAGAALAAILGAVSAFGLIACGSDSDSTTTTSTSTSTVSLRTKESADELPKLDRGFVVVHSRSGGFALARPPGWKPELGGSSVTALAPDRLVAVTVSADRSPAGLAISPDDFATRTARSLDGYRGKLKPGKPRPFKHRYEGVQVAEQARSSSGVRQELRVIVLRREKLVTFTAVIASNADRRDAAEVKQALQIVNTIRSRPNNGGKSKPTNNVKPNSKKSRAKNSSSKPEPEPKKKDRSGN